MIIALALVGLASSACVAPPGAAAGARAQNQAFAKRSIEIVALAADATGESKLRELIAPTATFELGAGDVGRPFGKGVTAARAFANELKAATYSFNGWDYMDQPASPCGPQEVKVEFVTADGKQSATVTFKYQSGLLQSAAGWIRSRESGPIVLGKRNG